MFLSCRLSLLIQHFQQVIQLLDGMTVENKGKLILNSSFILQKGDMQDYENYRGISCFSLNPYEGKSL